MFIDKVKIYVKAGNGGDGSASLHTEKIRAKRRTGRRRRRKGR